MDSIKPQRIPFQRNTMRWQSWIVPVPLLARRPEAISRVFSSASVSKGVHV